MSVRLGVSSKISLVIALVIIGTAGIISFISINQINNILTDGLLDELGFTAQEINLNFNSEIETLREDVLFLTSVPPVQAIIRSRKNGGIDPQDDTPEAVWMDRLNMIFASLLDAKEQYFQVRFIGVADEGLELVRVDKTGNQITPVSSENMQSKGSSGYFQNTLGLQSGEVYLSDINLNRENGQVIVPHIPTIRSSTPIFDESGQLFGMIVINMDLTHEYDVISGEANLHNMGLYLTNEDGDYLLNSLNSEKEFGFDLGTRYQAQNDFPELVDFYNNRSIEEVLPSTQIRDDRPALHMERIYFDPDNPERFLGLGISQPYSGIVAQTQVVVNQTLVVAILLTVVGVGVAVVFARQLIKPLGKIIQATELFSDGKMDTRLDIRRRDEFGSLANAFNAMAERIQRSTEDMRDAKEHLEAIVTQYMAFVERVADGDLTGTLRLEKKVTRGDDDDDLYRLGVNLIEMVNSLSQLAGKIRESAASVVSASSEIQAATTQQLASATEQDSSVTQTVATVDELRTTIQQTALRAQTVVDAAEQSVEVSRQGENAVNDTVDGMEMIRERVEKIAETILALSGRTQQIGEIIETVNALADQSKLLALNASIEAARAGEEGRGFAVVAMEVRQLAEQSRQATSRINDILSEIQQATNTAVMATEEGSKGAERGMELVHRAGASIRELAMTLSDVTQAAVQISASTHQQTNGMDQLSAAMQQIKQASMQAAASTRQAEQSARDLTNTAKVLNQAAERYKVEAST